jgi:hypothetical protein
MKIFRSLLVLALLLPASLSAQVTLDSLRVEAVRSRAFIRSAETQLTKVLALIDSLRAAPTPAPAPAPVPTAPPQTSSFTPNRPAGLTTVLDYDFRDSFSGNGTIGSSGVRVTDWDGSGQPGSGHCRTVADPSSATGRAFEGIYQVGESGTGPCLLEFSLGSMYPKVYVAWSVWYPTGFEHNGTSEKMLRVTGQGGLGYVLWEWLYLRETVYETQQANGCSYLQALDAPLPTRSGISSPCVQAPPDTRPVDGRWVNYELYLDGATGTVKWWREGVLHGSHVGRAIPSTFGTVRIEYTWGGGGNKQRAEPRRIGRWVVGRN